MTLCVGAFILIAESGCARLRRTPASIVRRPSPAEQTEPRKEVDPIRPRIHVSSRPAETRAQKNTAAKKTASARNEPVALTEKNSSFQGYRLQPGDPLRIGLRSIPEEGEVQDVIDEKGNITLPLIDKISAAGKTAAELEQIIQDKYISGKIYRHITVTVVLPTQKSYFVRGEVKAPGELSLKPGMTILQAIAAAGGYTDYADPRKTKVTNGNVSRIINLKQISNQPEKDEPVKAGDLIVVPRSIW